LESAVFIAGLQKIHVFGTLSHVEDIRPYPASYNSLASTTVKVICTHQNVRFPPFYCIFSFRKKYYSYAVTSASFKRFFYIQSARKWREEGPHFQVHRRAEEFWKSPCWCQLVTWATIE